MIVHVSFVYLFCFVYKTEYKHLKEFFLWWLFDHIPEYLHVKGTGMYLTPCVFVWLVLTFLEWIYLSYRDVTITGDGLQTLNFFFIVPHLLCHGFFGGGGAISSVSYRTEPISYRTEPIKSPFATSKGYWGSNLARIPTDYIYIQSKCICNNILQVCNLYTPCVHVISER